MKKKGDFTRIDRFLADLRPGEVCVFGSGQTGIQAVSRLLERFFAVSALEIQVAKVDLGGRSFKGAAERFRYLGCDYCQTQIEVLFHEEQEEMWVELLFSAEGKGETALFSWMVRTLDLQVEQVRCFAAYGRDDENSDECFFQSFQCVGIEGQTLPWLMADRICEDRWLLGLDPYHSEGPAKLGFEVLEGMGDTWKEIGPWIPEEIRKGFDTVELTDFLAEGEISGTAPGIRMISQVRSGNETGEVWRLAEDLAVEELSLRVEEGNLSVIGTILLWGTKVPVTIGIDEKESIYSLCVGNGTDQIKIADLGELAVLVKRHLCVDDFLPSDYHFGTLYVRLVYLEMRGDSWEVGRFSFHIGLEADWKILQMFELQEMELYFSCRDTDFFVLSGRLRTGDAELALEIRKAGEFQITGYMLNTEAVPLGGFLKDLRIASENLPQIGLEELRFSCMPQENVYAFSAEVDWKVSPDDLWQFEGVLAAFSLKAEKQGESWKTDVEISGKVRFHSYTFQIKMQLGEQTRLWLTLLDDPAVFRLQEFIRKLGYEEFVLPEGLDLALRELTLAYDFSEDKLEFLTVLEQGELYFRSDLEGKTAGKRRYFLAVRIEGEIDLAGIPVVGRVFAGDEAGSIGDFMLTAASEEIEELSLEGMAVPMPVQKGLAFLVSLRLQSETRSLRIVLGQTKSEAPKNDSGEASEGFGQLQLGHQIGPVYLQGIGIAYKAGAFQVHITASLRGSGLFFELEGLCAEYRLSDHTVHFGLQGIELEFKTAMVEAGGGFVNEGNDAFAGTLLISAAGLSLSAVGACQTGKDPSVFAFASLRGFRFGPPCFQVTEIAAGMGCSRSILIPPVEELEEFPLIQVIQGKEDLEGLLSQVDRLFPVRKKSGWIAAGIGADCFSMADAVVIATLQMGASDVFDLLGRAQIEIPYRAPAPVARASLLLKLTVDPEQGNIPIDGVLGSDSYVLSRDCHLSGGFSFYLWYGGEHRGDFVISLGGYNARYQRPEHYPSPQRLKLSWQLCPELYVGGSLYFALTPSAVMAGGDFQMDFTWKCVKAWFHAYVDILMCWKPYAYDFSVGISLGVNVNLSLFKLHFELGCSLSIWGPDFSGKACIHLWIISFTISFGHGQKKSQTISIQEFRESFLSSSSEDIGEFKGIDLAFTDGLIGDRQAGETRGRIVNAQRLQIQIVSNVPLTSLRFDQQEALRLAEETIWLRPCGEEVSPEMKVTVERMDQTPVQGSWHRELIWERVPSALWAPSEWREETIECCMGLRICVEQPEGYRGLSFTAACREEEEECHLPSPEKRPFVEYDQTQAYELLGRITDPRQTERREKLFEHFGGGSIDLSSFGEPREIFRIAPVLARTGGKRDGS